MNQQHTLPRNQIDSPMKNSLILKSLFLVVACVTATSSFAVNIPCRNCTEIGYAQRAVGAGAGLHYVFDYQRGNLRRYDVQCGGPRSAAEKPVEKDGLSRQSTIAAVACGPAQTLRAEQIDNEAYIEEGFVALKGYWDLTGGTMKSRIEIAFGDLEWVGSPGSNDAFQVLGNVNYRNALGRNIAVYTYQLYRLGFLSSLAGSFAGFTDGARIVIHVTFPDGTQLDYELNYPDSLAHYMPNTAFLPDGQTIPEANSPAFAGAWDATGWSGQLLNDWLEHMAGLGIPITSGHRVIRCTWDGHELRC